MTSDLTPSEIAEKMRRFVVGQEQTVRPLAVALHHHLLRHSALTGSFRGVPRCAVLLVGPTGCGKTLAMRTLSAIAVCPFVMADTTKLTAEGYVGGSVSDVMGQLLRQSAGVTRLAALGIVGLDEIDKVRAVPTLTRDVSGVEVQDEILSLLESPQQEVVSGPGKPKQASPGITLDTSGILVLLSGAFTGLQDIIAKRTGGRKRIGFGANGNQRSVNQSERHSLMQQLVPQDLVTYGLIPELVGRLTDICLLDELTREDMRRILLDAETGPLKTTETLAQVVGFEIRLTPPLVNQMVDEAMRSGLGARYLLSLVRRATGRAFFEMPDLLKQRRSNQALVTFGVSALRDGGYEIEWRKEGEAEPAGSLGDTDNGSEWLASIGE
jgi:ATP-dependent Clp protease ATP-binding subunit ClpX